MTSELDAPTLLNDIHASRGMQHINRTHARTFTLNVFLMNAQESIDITRRVNDPDEGVRLMAIDNKEAGQQTHREVTRRVHNFVAGALTLVEHTRIFMREQYNDLPIFERYRERVASQFAQDPLARFVQGLRNYMLHKGLPNSQMYLHFENGVIETGIRIGTAPLLEWDNWPTEARRYLESCGEFVDIRAMAEAYSDRVQGLHAWLQEELDQFHSADLDELNALQASFSEREAARAPTSPVPTDEAKSEPTADFVFQPAQAATLDAAGTALLGKLRQIDFPPAKNNTIPTDRPISANITDKDMLSTPQVWSNDIDGHRVFCFIEKDGAPFGLDEAAFAELQPLIENILQAGWASRRLSRGFLQKALIAWLHDSFANPTARGVAEAIAEESREAVQPLTLWLPIAQLETAAPFSIGPAEISTMNEAMFDRLEAQALRVSPQQADQIKIFYNDLRQRMQGFAAVVIKADVESGKLEEDGAVIARIAIAFLRYLSPPAVNFPLASTNELLGEELVPRSHLLVLGDETFSYKQALLGPYSGWAISEKTLGQIQPVLDILGTLVLPDGLNAFALAVRSSLLLFSAGTTSSTPTERLSYALAAVEALLLRHSAEPVEFSVAERMSYLAAPDRSEREAVTRNVHEAYRLRARQDISPLTPHEVNAVTLFLRRAHAVIGIALGNLAAFATVSEFVRAADSLRI